MAAAVKYFDTAKMGHCRFTTGITATDGSGASTPITWYNTAPATDWMLTRVIVSSTSATGVGNLADSLLHIFVDDGTTNRLIQTIDLGDPAVGSVSVGAWQLPLVFGPEFIFPPTVLVEFAISVTPTAGNVDVVVFAQAA